MSLFDRFSERDRVGEVEKVREYEFFKLRESV